MRVLQTGVLHLDSVIDLLGVGATTLSGAGTIQELGRCGYSEGSGSDDGDRVLVPCFLELGLDLVHDVSFVCRDLIIGYVISTR